MSVINLVILVQAKEKSFYINYTNAKQFSHSKHPHFTENNPSCQLSADPTKQLNSVIPTRGHNQNGRSHSTASLSPKLNMFKDVFQLNFSSVYCLSSISCLYRSSWSCFLDRAFSIWKTKINQRNVQINSGLIYCWSITPTCFGPSVEAIIREFEILESYKAIVLIC